MDGPGVRLTWFLDEDAIPEGATATFPLLTKPYEYAPAELIY